MILYVKNANFADANIGQIEDRSFPVTVNVGDGAEYTGSNKAKEGEEFICTIELKQGYTFGTIKVMMAGQTVEHIKAGNKVTVSIPNVTGYIDINVETIVEKYTFTINPTPNDAIVTLAATGYDTVTGSGSRSIRVDYGTDVRWSVTKSGYTSKSGSKTITGAVTDDVLLLEAGAITVLAETGSPVNSGYFGTIPINGFAPSMPVDSMPDEITGVRMYLTGGAIGDEKELTAFVGYLEGAKDGSPTIIKSTSKMVTFTAAKTSWTNSQCVDFPINLTKEEVTSALAGKTDVALTIGAYVPNDTEYTVGFRNCSPSGLSGTATADYVGGYYYLGKWSGNSSKQHIYAAFVTGDIVTTTYTVTYKYMYNGVEISPSKTETAYEGEIKHFDINTINCPLVFGYKVDSVSCESIAVTSDIEVIYTYVKATGKELVFETGAKSTNTDGYQSSNNLGINGFATSLDKTLLPDVERYDGIRAYLAGPTAGEVINMTAFVGYSKTIHTSSSGFVASNFVILKSTTKDVTMTGAKQFTTATDFDITITKDDWLQAAGEDGVLYVGWYPTNLDTYETYDIGAGYCKSSENETNMAADCALYHYKKQWSVNSKRQKIYAGLYCDYDK